MSVFLIVLFYPFPIQYHPRGLVTVEVAGTHAVLVPVADHSAITIDNCCDDVSRNEYIKGDKRKPWGSCAEYLVQREGRPDQESSRSMLSTGDGGYRRPPSFDPSPATADLERGVYIICRGLVCLG